MNLWRVLPHDRSAEPTERGGPLWFPRDQQGSGRHDNPDLYGCLYVAEDPVSAVAESLAVFRGVGRLTASMLVRLERPLALAELSLPDDSQAVDLDDPEILAARQLRPSRLATRHRAPTQGIAADLFHDEPQAVGLRWWSTLEASMLNWTLFEDRAAPVLGLAGVAELRLDDETVQVAATLLGLNP